MILHVHVYRPSHTPIPYHPTPHGPIPPPPHLGLYVSLQLQQFVGPLLHYPEVLEDGGAGDPCVTSQQVHDGGGITANLIEEGVDTCEGGVCRCEGVRVVMSEGGGCGKLWLSPDLSWSSIFVDLAYRLV